MSPSSHSQSLRLCGIGAVAAAACCGASTSYPDPCGCVVLFSCWGFLGATNETRRRRLMISSCLPWATLHASAEYVCTSRENEKERTHTRAFRSSRWKATRCELAQYPHFRLFLFLVFAFFLFPTATGRVAKRASFPLVTGSHGMGCFQSRNPGACEMCG